MWTAERWRRIEELFERASALPVADRATFLVAECAADPDLRARVERMLRADTSDRVLLDRTALPDPPPDPYAGQELGAWRVEDRIADGGMGAVYRAFRTDGAFTRPVAVKVLHTGLISTATRERFLREPRMLGRLEHPNIARLLDGGTTPSGTPFLVMELVDGVAIDRWCDARRLSLEARLRLFIKVCLAVDHAHRSLVVHCDLKPSNVLVTADGEPRLVDFGVAALLTGEADSGAPSVAAYTPAYAAPERLRGEPPTIANDVWSLGIMLHEIATGLRPFGADEVRSLAKGESIDRASRRPSQAFDSRAPGVAERAEARGAAPARLARRLAGDFDAIATMASSVEPSKRYLSARDLALDLERFLDGFPVVALPDRAAYRLRKFVRRHALASTLAIALLTSSLIGTVVSLAFAKRAEEGRRIAEQQRIHAGIEAHSSASILDSLTDVFLNEEFFFDAAARDRARDRIEAEAAVIRKRHASDSHLRANLIDALGRASGRIGIPELAEALIREALDLRVREFGPDHLEHALSLNSLGTLLYQRGEAAAARDALAEALRIHRLHVGAVHEDIARALNDLGSATNACGDAAGAIELHREALELRRGTNSRSLEVAESQNNLASALMRSGELALARSALDEAISIRRETLGEDALLTLQCVGNRGVLALRAGDAKAAIPDLEAAIAGLRNHRAAGTEGLASLLPKLAQAAVACGDDAKALAALSEAEQIVARLYTKPHPRAADLSEQRARLAEHRKDFAAAIDAWSKALDLRRQLLPPDHPAIEINLHNLGCARVQAGDLEAGLADLRASLEVRPPDHVQHATTKLAMAIYLAKANRGDEARALLAEARAELPEGNSALLERIDETARELSTEPASGGR